MNRIFAAAVSVPKTSVRCFSVTKARGGKPDMSHIKKKQVHFQKDDDVPVYLKGGTMDYILYYTTLGLLAMVKYVTRIGPRAFKPPFLNLLRMTSNDKEPCPSKVVDSSAPPPPPPPPAMASASPPPPPCPSVPPCPPKPPCPASICPPVLDPNNPCNYCPPPCIDPDKPDLTKLKKLQCLFQEDNDLPIYLKKGKLDALLYQCTLVLLIVTLANAFYISFKEILGG